MKACQILIVDDDKEDHLILHEYFQEAGVSKDVFYVENGQKAIDFLEGTPDAHTLPKLIVLDLNMPILNGTQTLLYLKQTPRFKNIPVIIYSTSDSENEKRKCLSFGAVDYVVKPITLEEGQRMVEKFTEFLK
jgi:CheY-like chemotaxis protein